MTDPMLGLLTSLLTREGTALVLPDPTLGIEGDGEAFAALVEGLGVPVGEGVDTPATVVPIVGVVVPVLAGRPDMPVEPAREQPVVRSEESALETPPFSQDQTEITGPVEGKAAPADETDSVVEAEVKVPQPEALPTAQSEVPVALPTVIPIAAGAPIAPVRSEPRAPDKVRESPRAALVERPSPKAGAAPLTFDRPEATVPDDTVRKATRPEAAPAKTEDMAKFVAVSTAPFVMKTPDPVQADAAANDPATVTARPSPPVHGTVTPRPSPPVATKPSGPTPRPTPPIESRPEAKTADLSVKSATPLPSPPVPVQAAQVQPTETAPQIPVAAAQPRPEVTAKLVLVPPSVDPVKAASATLANPLAASPAPVLVQTTVAPVATKAQPQSDPAELEIDTNMGEISSLEDLPEPLVPNLAASDSAPRATVAPAAEPRVMPERLQAAEVIRQIDAAVTRSDNGTIEVSLNPKELGQLTIRIEGQQNDTRMIFTAERPETLQLLKSHQGELQSALQASGFSQLDLSFADRSPGQSRLPTPPPAQIFADTPDGIPEPPRWENFAKRATSGRYDRRI